MPPVVRYLGHRAFAFEDGGGARVIIDPFGVSPSDNRFLKPFPPMEADLVAITHDHFCDSAADTPPAPGAEIMDAPGLRQVGGITVTGMADIHAGESGRGGMANVIYVVEMGGVRYCHMGDNRPDPPPATIKALGKIDALLISVDDSERLMPHEDVDRLIAAIDPKIVIPMGYRIEGLTPPESPLLGVERWAKTQPRRRPLRRADIRIDRRGLPYEREAWLAGMGG